MSNSITGFNYPETVNFHIKPIGVSGDPFKEGIPYNKPSEIMRFAKRQPKNVKIGDILIVYGVGTQKLIAIHRVTTLPIAFTQAELNSNPGLERWPWYIMGDNLTPNFGGEWWLHNFRLFDLADKYITMYPNRVLTSAGNKGLGALQIGWDRLKITREFAEFLINPILVIERGKVGISVSSD